MLHEGGYRLEDFLTLLVQAIGEADGCCWLALAFIKLQEKNQALRERILQALDACLTARAKAFPPALQFVGPRPWINAIKALYSKSKA